MTTPTTRAAARARAAAAGLPWWRIRRWLYGIGVAVAALLTFYRLLPPEAAPLWLGLLLAALNTHQPAPLPGEELDSAS